MYLSLAAATGWTTQPPGAQMLLVVPRVSGNSAACSCISGFLGQFIPFWESLSSLSCRDLWPAVFPHWFQLSLEAQRTSLTSLPPLAIEVAVVAPSIFSFVNLLSFKYCSLFWVLSTDCPPVQCLKVCFETACNTVT